MKNITNFTWILLIVFFFSCNNNETNIEKEQNNNQKPDVEEKQALETNNELYTNEDLKDLTEHELLILRNEIFARHGYIFQNTDLASHFSQLDWYVPKYDDVSEFLTDNDKINIELVLEYEAKLNNTDNFDIFLESFEKIDQEPFEISIKKYKSYNIKSLDKSLASKYLDVEIVQNAYEGCYSSSYYSIARFDFPDNKHIGLIVEQMTCPVPAVYSEFILFIFDNSGNIIDKVDIAYSRGDSEDFVDATSIFENMTFTKTETRVFQTGEDAEGYPILETEIQEFKIEFNPETAKVIETEI